MSIARLGTRRAPDLADFDGRLARCRDEIDTLSPPGPREPQAKALIGALGRSGLLADCLPPPEGGQGLAHHPVDPGCLLRALIAVGRADLSAGRLFEGHVNAVKLATLFARSPLRERLFSAARHGALLGVWGADGPLPVRLHIDGSGWFRLSGEKRYASGADLIAMPLVIAKDEQDRPNIVALSAGSLSGRLFPGEWSVSGMKATASGRCSLEGLTVRREDLLGDPGDCWTEPHFKGGVWRYAAVQLGGMYALARGVANQLQQRGQTNAPLQAMRLRTILEACETSRLWLRAAASEVESPGATPAAVPTAVLARLRVVQEATQVIAVSDEALGAASFDTSHPVERVRRDLQFYIRQANPDGMGAEALSGILADDALRDRWGLT